MSKRAPTSTPWVGSYARMTVGSRRNVRETATFCWFPPERNSTGCSSDGVRIFSCCVSSSTALRSLRRWRKPAVLNRRKVWIVALTRMPSTGINASCLRSPGSSRIPARTASWVEISIRSLPSQATRPARGGCRPARQSKSCVCPFPSAPAMPTISPRSSVKLTGPKDCPWSPSTTNTSRGSSSCGDGGGNAASNGRPTISSTRAASVVSLAAKVPRFCPSRRTVTRSATSSTSGSR